MNIPYHEQSNDWFCGPACLKMILEAQGKRVSQRELARLLGTRKATGTSRASLVRVGRRFGLRVAARHGRRLEDVAEDLKRGRAVVVLYLEKDGEEAHYAICTGIDARRITLRDPWHGPRYSLPRKEFQKRWRGSASRWTRWTAAFWRE